MTILRDLLGAAARDYRTQRTGWGTRCVWGQEETVPEGWRGAQTGEYKGAKDQLPYLGGEQASPLLLGVSEKTILPLGVRHNV